MHAHIYATLVCDNNARRPGLSPEHGLSIWLEAGNRSVLFDTGQGTYLPANLKTLSLPLDTLDAVVISHGHYDHTGGLAFVMEQCPRAKVFIHAAALADRYSIQAGKESRYIGMPPEAKALLHASPERVIWVAGPMEIVPGVWVTGPIPQKAAAEGREDRFYLDPEGMIADRFIDEQAVFVQSSYGISVILGCTHTGVANTLSHARALTGAGKMHCVMGGFHLSNAGPENVRQAIAAVRDFNPEKIAPCHCSGAVFASEIARQLPGFIECDAGTCLRI
ncbi:MAG: MBL fold metallo-hydrolase [Fibrobacterota bacterium]